jgi:hypothetical protein
MAKISQAVAAYRICAQAEGRSPKTVQRIVSSANYYNLRVFTKYFPKGNHEDLLPQRSLQEKKILY